MDGTDDVVHSSRTCYTQVCQEDSWFALWCFRGTFNSGKHGNLREFVNSGKLGEFEIYSGNFMYQMLFFVMHSETCNKLTCKFVRLQWYICELLVMVYHMLVDIIILGDEIAMIRYIGF